jgi:uncharacterized membrane-anchored protein YhcB (DUF1043 family)
VFTLLTPENLPATLTAVSLIITAIGGVVLYRVQKEPPKAGSQDAAAVALAENTKALQSQSANFEDNNDMFRAVLGKVDGMARDFAEVRHDMAEAKGHLASIRDALNRRAP